MIAEEYRVEGKVAIVTGAGRGIGKDRFSPGWGWGRYDSDFPHSRTNRGNWTRNP